MKQFIKDCLFFQHEDAQMKMIGALAWIWLAAVAYFIYWMINQ